MTLYYSIVFILLVFEMVLFMSLIAPMPFRMKRRLFTFLSENPIVAQMQYWLKIIWVFILVLFIDSVNRVYRVQVETNALVKDTARTIALGSDRSEVQARKFYSQRNMYLCGFTLFLSLILNRTYTMILDVLRLEDELKQLKGDTSAGGKESEKLGRAGGSGEIAQLKLELEKKDKELQAMKKQSEGLGKEYDRLGDQFTAQDSTPKKDR